MNNILLFNFFASFFIALFGINRKMGFWGYFFSSLLLTPLIGVLLVLVSDPKPKPQKMTE